MRPPATRVDVMTAALGQKSQIYTAPVRTWASTSACNAAKKRGCPFQLSLRPRPGGQPARSPRHRPATRRPSVQPENENQNQFRVRANKLPLLLPSFLPFLLAPSSSSFPRPRPSVPSCLPSFIKGEVIPSPKLFLRPPQLLREAAVEAAAGWKVRPVRVNRGGFFK